MIKEFFNGIKNKTLLQHTAFSYPLLVSLFEAVWDFLGTSPDQEPSPRQLTETHFIKTYQVKTIFVESNVSLNWLRKPQEGDRG